MVTLTVRTERWPIAGSFTIARGAKTEAAVVVVEIADGPVTGRGECVPYARYRETVEGVTAAIEGMRGALAGGLDRAALQNAMPTGAARNALDCAFWDFEAKARAQPVHVLAGLAAPGPLVTAYTISLGTRAFRHVVPVASRGNAAVVQALDQAMDQAFVEIANWALK